MNPNLPAARFYAELGSCLERIDPYRHLRIHDALWNSALSGLSGTAMFWWWERLDQQEPTAITGRWRRS